MNLASLLSEIEYKVGSHPHVVRFEKDTGYHLKDRIILDCRTAILENQKAGCYDDEDDEERKVLSMAGDATEVWQGWQQRLSATWGASLEEKLRLAEEMGLKKVATSI